ncbi:glycoside hydrolase family 92 protein [Pedobacter petrophilus]|uniref:Glycoside hydrolase family 92 protein n=2 Tax=Pedobacter petrophilus TaxID=1908241 RepID=A0A7K0FWD5_9SPHI|nr:GH92 family glycosyl hydrolase [Pedobacter petrophilus]MRX75731.1 glycoside hydrolase family 92 protein [Pedobacter petrophilus]
MNTANKALFLLVFTFFLMPCAFAQDLLQYVHPNIGTAHSRWFFYTPAAVPYGMAKLAPSTNGSYGNAQGWEAVGYDTRHNSIEGFVHFHEWQVGGVSFMPTAGELKTVPGLLDKPASGFRSAFDRKNEVAQPGYYAVLLDDFKIKAELTATKRVGFHRYTFPKNEESRIMLSIGNIQGESGPVTDASVKMIDETHFEGFVITYPKYVKTYDEGGRVAMYFFGELSKEPASVGAFDQKKISSGSQSSAGPGAGLFLGYHTKENESVEIKVGLSYTSVQNAKLNLQTEAGNLDFDRAKKAAQSEWQRELGKIKVTTKNQPDLVKFYTGLYHALLGRGIASDVNGSFPRHDGTIGQLPKDKNGKFSYHFMNTDAIWGGFWNLTQLWALSYPAHYNDFVHTQLEIYKERGWFGDGIANSNFVSGVGTNFVGLAIAGAYQAGIRDYDLNLAYRAVLGNELNYQNRLVGSGKTDTKSFVQHGFVPYLEADKTDSTGAHFSGSHTMEYSYSAFAAAQLAKQMGKPKDYQKLLALSNGWKLLFDKELKLIRPKTQDGKFIGKFNPLEAWRGFQEGNATQYTFYVPQNPKGLVTAIGSETFNNRLNDIFEKSQQNAFGGGKTIDAFAGIQSLYNHGNQPNLHISWLFNYSSAPWLTQKWTRAICNEFYGTESIHGYGYGQDEDQGQLGSWYVMASIGLFDVKGLTDARPTIQLGSPVFDQSEIQLGNGRKLVIKTTNNSAQNVYVQAATWNGKALNNAWMYRDELMKGGKLTLTMGSRPNKSWGVKVLPPSAQ